MVTILTLWIQSHYKIKSEDGIYFGTVFLDILGLSITLRITQILTNITCT